MLNASVALDHAALAEEIPLDQIDVSDPNCTSKTCGSTISAACGGTPPCITARKARLDPSGR